MYTALSQKPADPHSFDFWVGGYGSASADSEIWQFSIRDGVREDVRRSDLGDSYVLWGGLTNAIHRLIWGFDPEMEPLLLASNVPTTTVDEIKKRFLTPLVDPAMPVQDAIDLADFLVDMTKRYAAFLPGADVVGGETDIATVTRHEGFKWISRKHYYPEHLNRRDVDHA